MNILFDQVDARLASREVTTKGIQYSLDRLMQRLESGAHGTDTAVRFACRADADRFGIVGGGVDADPQWASFVGDEAKARELMEPSLLDGITQSGGVLGARDRPGSRW